VRSKLLNLLRGVLRLRGSEPDPGEGPNYGRSVSYTACRACGEGTLEYDPETDADVCSVCGERVSRE
jgi:uncharacterized protein (DUF983 family)